MLLKQLLSEKGFSPQKKKVFRKEVFVVGVTIDGTPVEAIQAQVTDIIGKSVDAFKKNSSEYGYEGKALFGFGINRTKDGLTADFMYGDTDGNLTHAVVPVEGKKDVIGFLKDNEIGVSNCERLFFKDDTVGATLFNGGWKSAYASVFEDIAEIVSMGTGEPTAYAEMESAGCKVIDRLAYGKVLHGLGEDDRREVLDRFGYKGKNLCYGKGKDDVVVISHSVQDQWAEMVDDVSVGIRKRDGDVRWCDVSEDKLLSSPVELKSDDAHKIVVYGKGFKAVDDFFAKNICNGQVDRKYFGMCFALDYVRPGRKLKPAKPKRRKTLSARKDGKGIDEGNGL